MSCPNWRLVAWSVMLVGSAVVIVKADETTAPVPPPPSLPETPNRTPAKPKELSKSVTSGLKYLLAQQHENGGFGQGGGWRTNGEIRGGRVEGVHVNDPPDVGNTCIAALALIRAGNTPKEGPYANQLTKAVDFVQTHVEQADQESLYVTPVRDTQLQSKIGTYVDTFLTALLLSELKGQMPEQKSEERLVAALNKTIGKIENHQKTDGTFAGNAGWASVLSQGICSKALNRTYQKGGRVKTETIKRDFDQSVAQLEPGTAPSEAGGPVSRPVVLSESEGRRTRSLGGKIAGMHKGDAGVSLYSLSANVGRVQEAVNSNERKASEAQAVLDNPAADNRAKDRAQQELKEVAEFQKANDQSLKQIALQIGDQQFLKGFGNQGGEEFLSYLNISETLFVQGGEAWQQWDRQACDIITKAQNQDGSWSGHHCITGRTFCTSAALLTMMADRASLPIADVKRESK